MKSGVLLMVAAAFFSFVAEAGEVASAGELAEKGEDRMIVLTDSEVRALRSVYVECVANPVLKDEEADEKEQMRMRVLRGIDVSGTPVEFQKAWVRMIELPKSPKTDESKKIASEVSAVVDSYMALEDVGRNHMDVLRDGLIWRADRANPKVVVVLENENGSQEEDEEATKQSNMGQEKTKRQEVYTKMKEVLPRIPLRRERDAIAVVYVKLLMGEKAFKLRHMKEMKEVGDESPRMFVMWLLEMERKVDLKDCSESFRQSLGFGFSEARKFMDMGEKEYLEEFEKREVGEDVEDIDELLYLSGVPFYELDEYAKEQFAKAFPNEEPEDVMDIDRPLPAGDAEELARFFEMLGEDMVGKIRSGYFKYVGGFDDYYIQPIWE